MLWYVLEHTRIGRYLFATGGNAESSRLAGVPTNRLIWGSLVASGAVCGLAGVLYNMRVGEFDSTVGPGYLFPAIAAVFLGASQLSRRPNVWGTLIAYFALAFGIQGLSLISSSAAVWSEPLFQGVALDHRGGPHDDAGDPPATATAAGRSDGSGRGAVMTTAVALLEVRGLEKRFAGTIALHDFDLDIRAGEVHALVGHNGSGKSTLVKILAGFHRPDGGTVRVAGRTLEGGTLPRRPVRGCASCTKISASSAH